MDKKHHNRVINANIRIVIPLNIRTYQAPKDFFLYPIITLNIWTIMYPPMINPMVK